MAWVYHGTPITPKAAFLALGARSFCVSYYRPDSIARIEAAAPFIMYDNGAFSFWKMARKLMREWEENERDWRPYYTWLEQRLFLPGRWAVIPDRIAAPTQLNDALLSEWPHGPARGAPVWHMDEPVERIGRLLDRGYDRICFGWVGSFDPAIGDIVKQERAVGCPAYHRKMEEVARFFGNSWPIVHMLRGVGVGAEYPFFSADSTSLAQNGWEYDSPMDDAWGTPWRGRNAYADRLELNAGHGREVLVKSRPVEMVKVKGVWRQQELLEHAA